MKKSFRVFAIFVCLSMPAALADEPVPYTIQLDVATHQWDGTFCWFHPRSASIPGMGEDGGPLVVMTLQKWFTSASDYFSGLSTMQTGDYGAAWRGPVEQPALAWRDEGDGVTVGICDFTPGWHAPTGKLLGIGHTVRYVDGHLMEEPRPRATSYAAYDPETGEWTPWAEVAMPDPNKFFGSGSGCGQWLTEPDGSLLVPVYYRAKTDDRMAPYSAMVMRCTFDGETLTYVEHGNEMHLDVPRGYCEPSITFHDGRYFLTLRNDEKGYVSVSGDGLHYAEPQPWTFDDGTELGSYNTQQHWAPHSDGLFLVYTRRGADNDHVPRNRAPLFIAQVDTEKLCVMKATEKVAIPERGAMMGNFGVATIDENETWITVGEGMFKPEVIERGANGSVFVSRIQWEKPNKLAGRVN